MWHARSCFGAGLLTSEVFLAAARLQSESGWATEEDLQPNIDGLSRDQVLLSSALLAYGALVFRCVSYRGGHHAPAQHQGRHLHV